MAIARVPPTLPLLRAPGTTRSARGGSRIQHRNLEVFRFPPRKRAAREGRGIRAGCQSQPSGLGRDPRGRSPRTPGQRLRYGRGRRADAGTTRASSITRSDSGAGQSGRDLFKERCTSCHVAPAPASRLPGAWPGEVRHMASRADLTPEQTELIAHYLQTVSEP